MKVWWRCDKGGGEGSDEVDFKLFEGFCFLTDGRTDIGDFASATAKFPFRFCGTASEYSLIRIQKCL